MHSGGGITLPFGPSKVIFNLKISTFFDSNTSTHLFQATDDKFPNFDRAVIDTESVSHHDIKFGAKIFPICVFLYAGEWFTPLISAFWPIF